jgi:predicted nucleotidyltransferase
MGTLAHQANSALFPGTRRKLLALFFLNADRNFYFSEVARLTATRQGVVQRELKLLTEAGILSVETRGRQKFYSANRNHPVFSELKGIVSKTFGVVARLQEALAPLASGIEIAFVHGSFSRGKETSGSDLDLFVVGDVSLEELVDSLRPAENEIGRDINPSLFAPDEFRRKFAQNNHFVRSVMRAEKELVVGTEDDLRRLEKE